MFVRHFCATVVGEVFESPPVLVTPREGRRERNRVEDWKVG